MPFGSTMPTCHFCSVPRTGRRDPIIRAIIADRPVESAGVCGGSKADCAIDKKIKRVTRAWLQAGNGRENRHLVAASDGL